VLAESVCGAVRWEQVDSGVAVLGVRVQAVVARGEMAEMGSGGVGFWDFWMWLRLARRSVRSDIVDGDEERKK
jgi:hypothetical protein